MCSKSLVGEFLAHRLEEFALIFEFSFEFRNLLIDIDLTRERNVHFDGADHHGNALGSRAEI